MAIAIDMAGKAALVTGAASGVGRATARKLADAGACVCLVDINAEALAETADLLRDSRALAHVADLSDPDACRRVVDTAVAKFGRLDALCNVAGTVTFAQSHTMKRADWDRTIAINLSAPFFLSQAAIPHLIEAEGAIVNVASFTAFQGGAYAAAYCASKAGLVNMTKALAMEYIRQPIRINAVAPGGMLTHMGPGFIDIPDGLDGELLQRFSSLRGFVEVDDVADMICLLVSPAGRSYHGACISIDAGITAG